MDTSEVADRIGTTPRLLRQFLRSNHSTFLAVGSGSRYTFTESDLPTLAKRFSDWRKDGKPRPEPTPKIAKAVRALCPDQEVKDKKVWIEEGPVEIADIRDPRIRARVRRDAEAAEARLHMMLLAAGLHITQPGFNSTRKAS